MRREWDALDWLRRNGFAGPQPLIAAEDRRFGFLRRGVLITEEWDGQPSDRVLAELAQKEADELIEAIEEFVRRLHAKGFRDRNLDLRNLLVRRVGRAWEIAKIDSPRWRLVRGVSSDDRLARADWARLQAQIDAIPAVRPR